jgi:hypothetical protein
MTAKSDTEKQIEAALREMTQELLTLRDEIRVRVGLSGAEHQRAWRELERRLAASERRAGERREAAHAAALELVRRLRELRDALRDQEERPEQGPDVD